MGNVEIRDSNGHKEEPGQELNLSNSLNYRLYCRHVEGKRQEGCLRDIPDHLLQSLSLYERLDASFNAITVIPSKLPLQLPHLNHLDLSHNRLHTLPDNICLLLHLETLLLRFNNLTYLPASLFRLRRLAKLDLSHNRIKLIDGEFLKLESLEKLDLSSNRLKVLPVTLGGLKTLKVLLASDNRFLEPLQSVTERGSEELLSHLRKNFNLSGQSLELLSNTAANTFPRVRGNHLQTSVPNPHSAQVQYIQSQTHTANTSSRIKTPLLPPPSGSDLEAFTLRDRILGLIYGAAIGDALGLATCCMTSDQCRFHYSNEQLAYEDIVQDELRVRWKKGDWTSNFDMMVLLLDSIVGWAGVIDELEYARRLYDWCLHGNAEIGETTGIVLSETIREVIEHSEFLKNPHSAAQKIIEKSTVHVYAVDPQCNANDTDDDDDDDYDSSDDSFYSDTESCRKYPPFPSSHPCIPSRQFGTDNGALVQIAILGVPYFHHPDEVEANTARICRTTHSHPLCVASCVVTTSLVSQMLQGRNSLSCHKSLEEILSCAITKATKYLDNSEHIEELNRYVNCSSIQNLTVGEQYNMSYVLKALGAAVLAVKSPLSYKSFMLNLFMEGGDSNSNGCVAGAILGCKVGYSKLPPEWLNGLRKQETEWLNLKINHLLDMIGLP